MGRRLFRLLFAAAILMAVSVAASAAAADTAPAPNVDAESLKARAEAGDAAARIELARTYLAADGSLESRRRAAFWLRRVVIDGQDGHLLEAMTGLRMLGRSLRQGYPDIDDAAYKAAHQSLGVALAEAGREAEAVPVLIEEAWYLNAAAQIYLTLIYRQPPDGIPRYDPRILRYFRQAAAEGLPRAKLFLGKVLLHGWGTRAAPEEGRRLLAESGFPEGRLVLAHDALGRGETGKAEQYFKAAAQGTYAEGYYHYGVFLQKRQRHGPALQRFRRALEIDPGHHEARLELARMYAEGWGTAKDPERALSLMRRVSDEAEGRTRAVAEANLGLFLLNGVGTEPDPAAARKHLEAAREAGVAEAARMLEDLGPAR